ncbi:hypothetical protein DUNSADRAFT_3541 [Dunaliella salina]|uniref:Encoded protein n=1 Tax=Dunaliella salina TaxID=3046 RepID=A0ABQ7H7W1_DUNSA|nr:hypothetical protein DUNSADRAFT_3541 [Dunaliella salina]|eukprot:KAF5842948.1 hypothetical protein DUNSADRAFT_3541 [Dunaliella salina]
MQETPPKSAGQTLFLDLPDDFFGSLYVILGTERRTALRHACVTLYKSPSINANIHTILAYTCREQRYNQQIDSLPKACHAEEAAIGVRRPQAHSAADVSPNIPKSGHA